MMTKRFKSRFCRPGLAAATAIAAIFSGALGAAAQTTSTAQAEGPKPATEATQAANAAMLASWPVGGEGDFADIRRGWLGTRAEPQIRDADGRLLWDLNAYAFIDAQGETAPDTVNPSLWRMARLNQPHGLFQVMDRIYQVRGFDISNMTIVEGDNGLILIDPLTAPETAAAALALYHQHRPSKPVVAVIYTHSHGDHFGGVKGVISQAQVEAGQVVVIAPDGFMEEAVSENVYAGSVMSRRGQFQFGVRLPKDARGTVDDGMGKTLPAARLTLIPPTDVIRRTGETRTIDGVEIEFMLAPGAEAPAEMMIYFPQWRALDTAEVATKSMHNLYPLRGAQVRDANVWWKALDDVLVRYGDRTEVVFAQHNWPTWGAAALVPYLEGQRDVYKFIHDQTLRLANQGLTPDEIGDTLELPPSLAARWDVRGYYGTVSHNARAVYQRYLGWYDGNPANLHPLPPEEAARKYVAFMGGRDRVLEQARESYAKGEYRWVAEVVGRLVFADPSDQAARHLEADALEQLGYQAESSTWRNAYLTGAQELRQGPPAPRATPLVGSDTLRAMTDEMFLDYLAIRLNGPKATGVVLRIDWTQPDTGARLALSVENSVFLYRRDQLHKEADVALTMSRSSMASILLGQTSLQAEIDAGRADVNGDRGKLDLWLGLLDRFDPAFAVVTP